jgi:hypothetical protein
MTSTVHRYTPTDPRLGRHVRHDSRSADYAVGVRPRSAIASVAWERRIPILDQLNVGACTTFSGEELLGIDALGYTGQAAVTIPKGDTKGEFKAGSLWAVGSLMALQLYRLVTRIDPYPGQWEPDDTGSDGLSVAKALVMLGLSDIYQHAFSYQALLSALQTGPVMIGSVWYNSMFATQPDGRIIVDPSSGEAGGHEYVSRQYDLANDRVWIDNTWGEGGFGVGGRGYFQGADLVKLLKAQGDVTVPHLVGSAVPVPPAPPQPPAPPTVSDAGRCTCATAAA